MTHWSSPNNIPTVAAEQVITEIGQHTSFQGIIDQLQCKDEPSFMARIAWLIQAYPISVAGHHQPNLCQPSFILAHVLPVC